MKLKKLNKKKLAVIHNGEFLLNSRYFNGFLEKEILSEQETEHYLEIMLFLKKEFVIYVNEEFLIRMYFDVDKLRVIINQECRDAFLKPLIVNRVIKENNPTVYNRYLHKSHLPISCNILFSIENEIQIVGSYRYLKMLKEKIEDGIKKLLNDYTILTIKE